jgi:septal ring factor EnvC (AmiA/AmiB activator)
MESLSSRKKPAFSVFFAALFAISSVFSGFAQTLPERARTEALARAATERLHVLQQEADRLASEERTLLGDLRKLDIDRQIKVEELKRADADAAKVTAELNQTVARMDALQNAARAEVPELQQRLVEIYKLGRARYLRLLLSTSDVRRLGESTRTVAALAKLDRDRVATHANTLAGIKRERVALEARRAEAVALRTGIEKAQAAVQRASQAKTDLVRDIDRRRDLNAQLSSELQAAQQKLQLTLRDMSTATPAGEAQLPLRPFRGALPWPVNGAMTRRFGQAPAANGVDIVSDDGAGASAVHDGTVAFAGPFAGFGNLVILDHGAQTFTLYGNLLDTTLKKGAHVDRGQPVGTVGPIASGADGIYFELRVDGHPVDPLQWLKKR